MGTPGRIHSDLFHKAYDDGVSGASTEVASQPHWCCDAGNTSKNMLEERKVFIMSFCLVRF